MSHNGNGTQFQNFCESLKDKDDNSRCSYLAKTVGGVEHKYCISKSEETRKKNPMTCLNFTGVIR